MKSFRSAGFVSWAHIVPTRSEIIVRHLYAILQPGHLNSNAGHQSNRVAVNQGSIIAQPVQFCEIGPDRLCTNLGIIGFYWQGGIW